MAKNGVRGRTPVDAETFVKMWQRAESVTSLAAELGVTKQAASTRARGLRKRGVPLRRFPKTGRPRLDVASLTALAKKYAPKAA